MKLKSMKKKINILNQLKEREKKVKNPQNFISYKSFLISNKWNLLIQGILNPLD